MIGLVIAHDKALALFGTTKDALRTQYPLLGLMILYTAGGLWLLSRGLTLAHGGRAGLIVEISTLVAISALLVLAAIQPAGP